jgi:hypothetical protein
MSVVAARSANQPTLLARSDAETALEGNGAPKRRART